MYIYMTTGTRDFMGKIKEKHASKQMILMHGSGASLLLHETEGKSVFQTPRRYEVISSAGNLQDEGYFVCNNIPVSDEGRPVFEHRFSTQAGTIESQPGFVAFRLLRPLDSETYIVMTEWNGPADFDRWKNSSAFKEAHDPEAAREFVDNTTHIFTSASYITTYTAKREDEA